MRLALVTSLPLLCALMFALPTPADEVDRETLRLSGLALDRLLTGQARIMAIADRLRIAGAPFCGKKIGPVMGVYTATQHTFTDMFPGEPEFEKALSDAATQRFDLGRRQTVLLVAPGLAADRAGLRVRDVVTKLNGKKLKGGTPLDVLSGKRAGERVRLVVERGSEALELEVESELGCMAPSRFWFSTRVNAFATHFGSLTGTYVLGGMLDFLESDDELGVILGHELAHLILTHTSMRTTHKNEADADYLGVYLAARAGFEVDDALELEDRFARDNPYSTIDWGFYSHPTSPRRSLQLLLTLDEIHKKVEGGLPLMPERRQ
jgi:hypothetical protein